MARTVDIHRKPGYDPVELHFDPATKGIPLGRAAGSGLARGPGGRSLAAQRVLLSEPTHLPGPAVADTDVFGVVLRHFGGMQAG